MVMHMALNHVSGGSNPSPDAKKNSKLAIHDKMIVVILISGATIIEDGSRELSSSPLYYKRDDRKPLSSSLLH